MPDPTRPDDEMGAGGPAGLLLSRDLIFTTKVTGTARALGLRLMTAGTLPLATSMLDRWRPRAVLVDLAAADLAAPPALIALRRLAGPETTFLAFGSHVDVEALHAARDAGCDPVLPRSQFTAQLPDLLRRYLGDETSLAGDPT